MNEAEFKTRTKELALRTIRLIESLPKTSTSDVLGRIIHNPKHNF